MLYLNKINISIYIFCQDKVPKYPHDVEQADIFLSHVKEPFLI